MIRFISFMGSLVFGAAIIGCSTLIPAPYSQGIYDQLVDAQKDALVLMDKGTGTYADNQSDVEALTLKMETLKNAILKRSSNKDISYKQYEILMAPDKGLLGEFLIRWKEKGPQSKAFLDEWKTNVTASFDEMISTETARKTK
jgi:hypothetical protein